MRIEQLEAKIESQILSIMAQRKAFRGLSEKAFDIHELNLKRKRRELSETMRELLLCYHGGNK